MDEKILTTGGMNLKHDFYNILSDPLLLNLSLANSANKEEIKLLI